MSISIGMKRIKRVGNPELPNAGQKKDTLKSSHRLFKMKRPIKGSLINQEQPAWSAHNNCTGLTTEQIKLIHEKVTLAPQWAPLDIIAVTPGAQPE